MNVAIVGAGWAGLSAAIGLTQAGHHVTVFEAARQLGGRARSVAGTLPNGDAVMLDNGQHILIGAYTDTLALMKTVGVSAHTALLRKPLSLQFPDGCGIRLPAWPSPLDALAGIAHAKGWSLADKFSLFYAAVGWQISRFKCPAHTSVATLCARVTPRVMLELIEPLCVSALNTPAPRASGEVFLRVLSDSLFGIQGGSNLLLPAKTLSELMPEAGAHWLAAQGAKLQLGTRVNHVSFDAAAWRDNPDAPACWHIGDESFARIVLAVSASDAVRVVDSSKPAAAFSVADEMAAWVRVAEQIQFEGIATVYAMSPGTRLAQPMLALRSTTQTGQAPAQFVFDKGQLGGPAGMLAFVVSASVGSKDEIQAAVVMQAQEQLGLMVQPLQTIVEKRATFACTPGLVRPKPRIAPGLLACGDYVAGPYPATLEGAVRSGIAITALL